MESVERELRTIRSLVQTLVDRLDAQEQSLFKPSEAAKRLGISVKHLKALVKESALIMVPLGRRMMVPASEIARLSTPIERTAPPKRHRSTKMSARAIARTEAEQLERELKKR